MGVQGALLKLHRVEHASHSQPNLNPMLHPKPGHRQALLYEADDPSRTVLTRPAPHVTAYIRPQSLDSPRLSSTALCYREPVSVNTERTTDRDYLDFLKTSLSPIITQSAPTACLRIASDYHFSSVGRGVAEQSIFGTAGETGSPDSRGKFCPQRQETISFHHIV